MISNNGHYASAAGGSEGIPAPSLQNQDVILEAWREVLGQVLHERDNEWKQQLRAIKAESMAAVAELRANAAEIRGTVEAMIEKRLSQIREPADGPRGVPGPRGEPVRPESWNACTDMSRTLCTTAGTSSRIAARPIRLNVTLRASRRMRTGSALRALA